MRRSLVLSLVLAAVAPALAGAALPPEQRTVYHYAEKAWAVGTVRLEAKPLPFRDGKLLVYPSQIVDLLWAPKDAKPRNLMLVHEVLSSEVDDPFFKQGEEFFAAIQLLPEHAYYKDNLPPTRRHVVAGGRRYVFRGDDIAEARRILGAYLKATGIAGTPRWAAQLQAVADGLVSTSPTIRDDSVRYFVVYPTLARDFPESAMPRVKQHLEGEAPVAEKRLLVETLVSAKVAAVEPLLGELAGRDDATGMVALGGLDRLGKGAPTARLLALSRSEIAEVRQYAAGALGRRAADDPDALARVSGILEAGDSTPGERVEATQGMARAGGDAVVAALAAAVARGDASSRPAGTALGEIGSPAAQAALTKILVEGRGEAAVSAAYGLGSMRGCRDCAKVLHEQHDAHPDPEVRSIIGVSLGVPLEHKH